MALYVIGDLHLSLSGNKSMDIFPGGITIVTDRQNWLQDPAGRYSRARRRYLLGHEFCGGQG